MLGTGFIADFRIQAYQRLPDVRLVSVLGRDPDRTKAFATNYGFEHSATSFEALLAGPDFDIVDLCLPNHLHREFGLLAAEAGKHIICEKPLARTATEAQEMLNAAESAGIIHCYAENWIFSPELLEVQDSVRQGVIGRPLWLRAREGHFGPHSPWFYDAERAGGGALIDMGCHIISTFNWLIGEPVSEVFCHTETLHHDTDCEDNAIAIVRYEGGAVGQVEASWTVRGGMAVALEIWGDEGTLTYDRSALSQPIRIFANKPTSKYFIEKGESDRGWLFPMVDEFSKYGYLGQLSHFLDCIRNRTEPALTFQHGLEVNRIIDQAYASSRAREWQPLQ